MSVFGSQYLDHRIWIYAFGHQDFDLWDEVSGIGPLGLGLRIWISGFVSQDLDLWVWV